MPTERLIGIDFGTSTSVIRVKRYRDGRPVDDRLTTAAVTFNMGSTMLPTLIRKLGGAVYYGYDAQVEHKNSELYRNFKMRLESADLAERREARALTEAFFRYMAKMYQSQSVGGYLGEGTDVERTLVSYPVKWTQETKRFLLEAARKAGFSNVVGEDEAQAAIHAALVQNDARLSKKGYLKPGQPLNILLVDMGAGTTDIVVSHYVPGKPTTNQVLCTWPKGGRILFGGREVDAILAAYVKAKLPPSDAERIMARCSEDAFKTWKDTVVSPALKRNETVNQFAAMDNLLGVLGMDVRYRLSRAEFEAAAAPYLPQLPTLVKGSLTEAKLSGNDIDLVILAGGHSQWYFVKEMLADKLRKFGSCGLGKVIADPGRIISITRPQETVALGLVYRPLNYVTKTEPRRSPLTDSADKPGTKPAPGFGSNPVSKSEPAPKDHVPLLRVESMAAVPEKGTVVTGRVLCDAVRTGNLVRWSVNGQSHFAKILGMETGGRKCARAVRADAVRILLAHITPEALQKGVNLYVKPNREADMAVCIRECVEGFARHLAKIEPELGIQMVTSGEDTVAKYALTDKAMCSVSATYGVKGGMTVITKDQKNCCFSWPEFVASEITWDFYAALSFKKNYYIQTEQGRQAVLVYAGSDQSLQLLKRLQEDLRKVMGDAPSPHGIGGKNGQ